jgi:hypothetical protein
MERFDCHGQLHVALQNDFAIVEITHQQLHKSYPAPLQHSLPPTASQFLVSGTHGPYVMTKLLAGVLS